MMPVSRRRQASLFFGTGVVIYVFMHPWIRSRKLVAPLGSSLLSILFTAAILLPLAAQAKEGGAGPGGGDRCDQRFQDVVKDISAWIDGGGHENLDYGARSNPTEYKARMKAAMSNMQVECVMPNDPQKPVKVNGIPKECINWIENGQPHYRCELGKFYRPDSKEPDNDPLHYRIVHHELASRAGLEPHDGAKSSYHFSDQLDAFLENRMMKRLAIKPKKKEPDTVPLKLDRVEKAPERRFRDSECSKVVNKVTAYERKPDGKDLKRIEVSEEACLGQQARTYTLRLYSADGKFTEQKGLGMSDGFRDLGKRLPEHWLRVQGLYREFHIQNKDCQVIHVNAENGGLSGYEDCPKKRFSEQPRSPEELPLDNGVAPAA